MVWDWIKRNKMAVVNLIGSAASIIGFTILILSMVDANSVRTPETKVWQYAFFAISLIAAAAVAVFSCIWVKEAFDVQGRSLRYSFTVASMRVVIGVLLLAIALDGTVSAINWTIWFWEPYSAIREMVAPPEANQRLEDVAQITKGELGTDGQHLTIHAIQPDSRELILAVPQDQLRSLINLAAAGFTLNELRVFAARSRRRSSVGRTRGVGVASMEISPGRLGSQVDDVGSVDAV